MGWFDGVNPISALVSNTVGKVVDKALSFIPDPVQQAQFIKDMRTLDLSELQQQVDINKIEAASQSWFESNWRPAIGWVCAAAFGYKFVVGPFLIMVVLFFKPTFNVSVLPVLDWTELSTILLGMLGLSRDRSKDKANILAAKGNN